MFSKKLNGKSLLIIILSLLLISPCTYADVTNGLVAQWTFNPGEELLDKVTTGEGASDLTNYGVTFADGIATFDGGGYLVSTEAGHELQR